VGGVRGAGIAEGEGGAAGTRVGLGGRVGEGVWLWCEDGCCDAKSCAVFVFVVLVFGGGRGEVDVLRHL
jgi:hypothetical protein